MTKKQKILYIDEDKLKLLKEEADDLNVSVNSLIMFRVFAQNKKGVIGE